MEIKDFIIRTCLDTVNDDKHHKLESHSTYDDREEVVLAVTDLSCATDPPQNWPHPSLTVQRRPQTQGWVQLFVPSLPPHLLSKGRRAWTNSPSVWKLNEQRLNSLPGIIKLLNEQGAHTEVTESEWMRRDTGRGKRARRKKSHLGWIHNPTHTYIRLGSEVCRWRLVINKYSQSSPLHSVVL